MEFVGTKRDGATVRFIDNKRWLWLFSLSLPLLPIFAFLLYMFGAIGPIVLAIPLVGLFVILPVLDALVGGDPNNPPEEIVPSMSADRFYEVIAYMLIPPYYVAFILSTWLIATQELPFWVIPIVVLGGGMISANAIIIGHELGHKTDKRNRNFAKLAMGLSGYGHFIGEHNRGHHVRVSTPGDCASARMGESVYIFALRELPGAFIGGWNEEAKRMHAKSLPLFHWKNEILQVYALNNLMSIVLVIWLGWIVLPFILAHHLVSWYGLTQVNYIEHYGLLRQKLKNGKYEPCQPRHSWNSNHRISNLVSFHLQRHSDHHANPMRPYQALRDFQDAPCLPSGYPGCLVLAAIPPLWFRIMDPKVMDWAGGDIEKVNKGPL